MAGKFFRAAVGTMVLTGASLGSFSALAGPTSGLATGAGPSNGGGISATQGDPFFTTPSNLATAFVNSSGQTIIKPQPGHQDGETDTIRLAPAGDHLPQDTLQKGPIGLDVSVPEPVTISIMGIGLLGLCLIRRRPS